MSTIIYLAGPITGVPDYLERFASAAGRLEACGFTVINPALVQLDGDQSWQRYMRATTQLLTGADGVAVLDGWPSSRGALCEVLWAIQVGLIVRPVDEWIRAAGGQVTGDE